MDLNRKIPKFGLFLDKQVCRSQTPQKGVQILLQILKPLSDMEILTPELVGDQIEMVAS